MTDARARWRFAPRIAVLRDPAREAAAERVAQGAPAAGRPSTAPAPVELGLGPGQGVPAQERRYFERRLGVDLSSVRVHPDASVAAALDARAFAAGRDIGIAPGQWQPGSAGFRRLIGHEIAHTIQQGRAATAVQLDGPDPPLKEAKPEDATGAVEGGLKTFADQAGKNDAFKTWGLDFAKRYALPIWTGMSDADKAAAITWSAATVGVGLGALAGNPAGRAKLSGVNIGAPLSLVPYAVLSGFSFDLPKTKTDPLALHFSFKGDDLLDLAHEKAGTPKMSLSFDLTMDVSPSGHVSMPFMLANFGVMPGVNLAAGWGVATDFKTLTPAGAGGPLAPVVDYPTPATPAPPAGVAVFLSIDLLKTTALPLPLRLALGGVPDPKDKP